MSGEITITPGKTWTDETIDKDKLNLTAAPTAQLDADSVTSTEIDSVEFLSTYADSFRERNFLYNPVMWGQYWEDTSASGKSCPAGEYTENATGWWVNPTGAACEYRQEEDGPGTSLKNQYAVKVVGATSVTEVIFGQFLSGGYGAQLATDVAFSCEVKGTEGAVTALTAEIYVCGTAGDWGTLAADTVLTKGTSGTQPDGWTRMNWTGDLSAVTNMEYGIALVLKLPTGHLDADTKSFIFTQMQLETSVTPSSFINPVDPLNQRYDVLHASDAPTVSHDMESGYHAGSLHIDQTDPDAAIIHMASKADKGAAIFHRLNWLPIEFVHVYDSKTDGTDGGGYTTGSHVVRDLTTMTPTGVGYDWSLATNQMTLPAGSYIIHGTVPCYRTGNSAAWLYDTTGAAMLVNGSTVTPGGGGGTGTANVSLLGMFTLTVESVLEIRFEANTSRATDGLGPAAGLSRGAEIYTNLLIGKLPT